MLSGQISPDEMAELLAAGADDYLPKPPSIPQLVGRVKAALSLKDAQDRSDVLNRHLLSVNAELERSLHAGATDLKSSCAQRPCFCPWPNWRSCAPATPGSRSCCASSCCCRCLAEEASALPAFAGQIDANFIAMLECCAPLHDIGLAALPDYVLHKAGKFDHDERLVMQTHTTLGADILQGIARRHRSALALLQTAADVARHHHETYDGTGYPDRLSGTSIPLAARIVAVADVYIARTRPSSASAGAVAPLRRRADDGRLGGTVRSAPDASLRRRCVRRSSSASCASCRMEAACRT